LIPPPRAAEQCGEGDRGWGFGIDSTAE